MASFRSTGSRVLSLEVGRLNCWAERSAYQIKRRNEKATKLQEGSWKLLSTFILWAGGRLSYAEALHYRTGPLFVSLTMSLLTYLLLLMGQVFIINRKLFASGF